MDIKEGGPVESSNIQSVLWTGDGLVVVFHDGGSYLYPDAGKAEFDKLYNARSHGEYFASNIKGRFTYAKLE